MCIHYLEGNVGSCPEKRPDRVVPTYTVDQLRTIITDFVVQEYHERVHGTTRMKPRERWLELGERVRPIQDQRNLDFLLKCKKRQVRVDGVYLNTTPYIDEACVLHRYLGKKVLVLHDPRDPSEVRIWYQQEQHKHFVCCAYPQGSPNVLAKTIGTQNRQILSGLNQQLAESAQRRQAAEQALAATQPAQQPTPAAPAPPTDAPASPTAPAPPTPPPDQASRQRAAPSPPSIPGLVLYSYQLPKEPGASDAEA